MTQLVNTKQENVTPDVMNMLMQYTNMFAEASIVPNHYRGRKGDIFIAVQTAHRMNLDPMMVMQGTYVIHGNLAMGSAFAISLANSSGLLKSGITYKIEGSGENLRVTAKAIFKSTDEEISYSIGMKEAKGEGWTKNPKYQTLPELMLRYKAATLLIRTHMPQVLNGMHTVEELKDVQASKSVKEVVSNNNAQNLEQGTEKVKNRLESFLGDEDEKAAANVIEHTEDVLEVSLNSDIEQLKQLISTHSVPESTLEKWCEAASVATIEELPDDKIARCIEYINNKFTQVSLEVKNTC